MKRCPTCRRTYTDDSQKFCLDDGTTLIEESATPFDPQATLAIPGAQPTTPPSNPYGSGAGQGSYGSGAGQGSYGAGAGAGQGSYGSGAGQGSYGAGAGQGSYGSGAGQSHQTPSWSPTPPGQSPAARKRSVWPWVLGGAAVLIIGFIGLVIAIVLYAASNGSNANNSNSNTNNSNYRANINTNANRSNSNARTNTGRVITSTDGKMQVTAPSSWSATTGLNDKADLQVADKANEMYMIVLTDNKSNYGSMTINRHSDETLGTLTKSMTYSNKLGPTSLTINGNPAVQYEVRGEIKEINVVYVHTTVETPEHFQQIVAWTLQSTYDENKGTLQSIIESFKEND